MPKRFEMFLFVCISQVPVITMYNSTFLLLQFFQLTRNNKRWTREINILVVEMKHPLKNVFMAFMRQAFAPQPMPIPAGNKHHSSLGMVYVNVYPTLMI